VCERFSSLADLGRGADADMSRTRDEQSKTHRYLQTKYRELQEQFVHLRHLYLRIECAWCKRHIRWQRKTAAVPGDTSHGICPPCAARMLRGIAKLRLLLLVFMDYS
jgi:hypothetical protein